MKRQFLIGLILTLTFQFANAQNYEWPNSLSIGGHANDYFSPFKETTITPEFFEYGLQLAYHRNIIKDYLNVEIPFRMGTATVASNDQPLQEFTLKQSLFSFGALAQLQYYKSDNVFVPYLSAGGNYTYVGEGGGHLEVPLGVGVDIKIGNGLYFQLRPEYRLAFKENRNNWNFYTGLKFKVGKKRFVPPPPPSDRDKDGVPDLLDKCPDIKGKKKLAGCPDKDRDGIADHEDLCPKKKGLAKFGGCPDSDADGVQDSEDDCPKVKGPEANKGCPYADADGDGITDDLDKCKDIPGLEKFDGCPDSDGDDIEDAKDDCPNERGPVANNGCPYSDKDNDGVRDSEDNCPTVAGPASNKGCPERKVEEVLSFAMQNVRFETNSNQLLETSNSVLDEVANVLLQYPDYKVTISGHTDSVGDAGYNQQLSEKRAKSCADYLISKGVAATRIGTVGLGETQPISDNSTTEGQRMNRRVEFNIYK